MKYEGFAIDISNWSGEITLEQVECWKRNHVTRVIVGTQNEKITRQQMQTLATEGGLELQAYVFLYGQLVFADQVKKAVASYNGFPVTKLWLDCEFATIAPPDVVVARIQNAVDYCEQEGIAYGIYTGEWWWVPKTDNSKEFNHIDLWDSRYPVPSLPPDYRAPFMDVTYGGWWARQMWQYRGTTEFCGVTVDFNYYREGRMMGERIEELEAELVAVEAERDEALVRLYVLGEAVNAAYKGKWLVLRNIAEFMMEREDA